MKVTKKEHIVFANNAATGLAYLKRGKRHFSSSELTSIYRAYIRVKKEHNCIVRAEPAKQNSLSLFFIKFRIVRSKLLRTAISFHLHTLWCIAVISPTFPIFRVHRNSTTAWLYILLQ